MILTENKCQDVYLLNVIHPLYHHFLLMCLEAHLFCFLIQLLGFETDMKIS